ncbi:MAG: hypothetical protein HC836_35770 [Richelia sp. RM2_1_2]|nr:hypothetical protein [Richelia sp. RM2_1_2]
MLKQIAAFALTSVSLLSLNVSTVLAKPADTYSQHKTFYPSNCSVFLKGSKFDCNYVVIGAFDNGTGNIKLCSKVDCLILMLNRNQLQNAGNGKNFYIWQMSWQKGSYIEAEWDTSMRCNLQNNEMSCIGEFNNGSSISVYVK